jgi:tRNA-specific 2-thiouridylase
MSSKGSVLVAMSGGVDSSVAACLLADQGYEVLGSHMRLVHLDGVEHGCCGPLARRDAEEVARMAGFPFEIADLTDEFEREVIGGFVAEHAAGRTPNPCATCNGQIKFGAFLRRANQLGIDAVATGHYVRSRLVDGTWRLLRGRDRDKDQSYMLHMLGQRQLARSLFPVGNLEKGETRRLAAGFGLPVAGKPDSQELCFAPAGDGGGFLRTVAPRLMRPGHVVDTDGRVLAQHDGAAGFTVGQRRGVGVAVGEPRYVIALDPVRRQVTVGSRELLASDGLVADRATWVTGGPPSEVAFDALVRIRYRGRDAEAVVTPMASGFEVRFDRPEHAVAPGQSAVVYRGDELLGGGRIVGALGEGRATHG